LRLLTYQIDPSVACLSGPGQSLTDSVVDKTLDGLIRHHTRWQVNLLDLILRRHQCGGENHNNSLCLAHCKGLLTLHNRSEPVRAPRRGVMVAPHFAHLHMTDSHFVSCKCTRPGLLTSCQDAFEKEGGSLAVGLSTTGFTLSARIKCFGKHIVGRTDGGIR
jgi:hypothetical protein